MKLKPVGLTEAPGYPSKRVAAQSSRIRRIVAIAAASAALWAGGCGESEECPRSGGDDQGEMRLGGVAPPLELEAPPGDAGRPDGQGASGESGGTATGVMDGTAVGAPLSLGLGNPDGQGQVPPATPTPPEVAGAADPPKPPEVQSPPEVVRPPDPVRPPDVTRTAGVPRRVEEPPPVRLGGRRPSPRL